MHRPRKPLLWSNLNFQLSLNKSLAILGTLLVSKDSTGFSQLGDSNILSPLGFTLLSSDQLVKNFLDLRCVSQCASSQQNDGSKTDPENLSTAIHNEAQNFRLPLTSRSPTPILRNGCRVKLNKAVHETKPQQKHHFYYPRGHPYSRQEQDASAVTCAGSRIAFRPILPKNLPPLPINASFLVNSYNLQAGQTAQGIMVPSRYRCQGC